MGLSRMILMVSTLGDGASSAHNSIFIEKIKKPPDEERKPNLRPAVTIIPNSKARGFSAPPLFLSRPPFLMGPGEGSE